MNNEQFIGVFCVGCDGKYLLYAFEEIKAVDYIDFIDGRSNTLEAVFRISNEDFGTGKSIKWALKQRPVLYVDAIKIKSPIGHSVVYDVVGDMIVECATSKHAKVVRVRIEKDSVIGDAVQKNGYILVGKDTDYKYLEVDAENFGE